jgi:hypothetical protein
MFNCEHSQVVATYIIGVQTRIASNIPRFETRCLYAPNTPPFKRLMLQIEMDLFAFARLRLLLAEDDPTELLRELPLPTRRTPRNGGRRA